MGSALKIRSFFLLRINCVKKLVLIFYVLFLIIAGSVKKDNHGGRNK